MSRSDSSPEQAAGAEELRARLYLMLEAFEREEPSKTWLEIRELVDRSSRLSVLRSLLRDLRGAVAALSPSGRRTLETALQEQFGPDSEWQRELAIVERVRARGRIRSEREYRAVQAYQDSIAGDRARQDEFLALGAMLDDFSAAP